MLIEEPLPTTSNNAGWVIRNLRDAGFDVDQWRIMCRDTEGHWVGLATKDRLFSSFIGFSDITDQELAVRAALAREPWISAISGSW